MTIYTLHFDGSCGPINPGGMGGYGFILKRSGRLVSSGHGQLGDGPAMTNNYAEFAALHRGLQSFAMLTHNFRDTKLEIYGDSQLVIKVMNSEWRPGPDRAYYPAYLEAYSLLRGLESTGIVVTFQWIPREENQECDDLSKADPVV